MPLSSVTPRPYSQSLRTSGSKGGDCQSASLRSGKRLQGLAARLDQQGDDLPGWLKLVRAYSVLDRKDDAQKALARAKSQFSGNTQAIEQLDALAAELGLKS